MEHEFRSFWLGERISPFEYLSIESFLSHGHRYVLYSYDEVAGLPQGCELADAREVLPEEKVFLTPGPHKRALRGGHSESPSGFANLFRYKLLRDEGGWWVDTDVLCRRAEIPDSEYVFALENVFDPDEPRSYGNAVLRAPKGSALMSLAFERALEHGSEFEYTATGPPLLTTVIDELGLGDASWARTELYPLSWRDAVALLDRAHTARLEKRLETSIFCHFWSSLLAAHDIDKDRRPPEGSLLDRLYVAYDVPAPARRGYSEAELRAHLAERPLREQLVLQGNFVGVARYLQERGVLDQLRATLRVAEQLRGRPLSGEGADVAAGCLWAMPHLFGSGPVERVYAVERSRHRLQTVGPAVLRHYGVPAEAVVFCPGSLSELGLPDRCLDFVLLSQALPHAEDSKRLLAEVRRVLAPDGVVLVIGEPLLDARLVRRWPKHLLRETLARTVPHALQRRARGRVVAPAGWRLPDRWTRDPVTGDQSYLGSTYARLFARAGFTARHIPDVEHDSQSFVLRTS